MKLKTKIALLVMAALMGMAVVTISPRDARN